MEIDKIRATNSSSPKYFRFVLDKIGRLHCSSGKASQLAMQIRPVESDRL